MRIFSFLIILMALAAHLPATKEASAKAERHFKAGMAMLSKGRFKDAKIELSIAQAIAPGRSDILEALAAAEGGAQGAMPSTPPSRTPPSPETPAAQTLSDAREAYRSSELARARDAWNRALLLQPSNSEAAAGLKRLDEEAYAADKDAPFDSAVRDLYEGGLREARKERYVEAKRKLEEALTLNPTQAQVKSLLSKIESGAFAQSSVREAEEALRQADRAMAVQDWGAAGLAYGQALQLKPGDPMALAGQARLREKAAPELRSLLDQAVQARDPMDASDLYRRALRIDPRNEAAAKGLHGAEARLKAKEGRLEAKDRANGLYNQGVDAWQAGDLALAAGKFKEALSHSPRDKDIRKALDLVQAKLGKQLYLAQADAAQLMARARDFESKGKLKEALESYERASARGGDAAARAEAERLKRSMGLE